MVLVELCRGKGCYRHTNHLLSKGLDLYLPKYISYYDLINFLVALHAARGAQGEGGKYLSFAPEFAHG